MYVTSLSDRTNGKATKNGKGNDLETNLTVCDTQGAQTSN